LSTKELAVTKKLPGKSHHSGTMAPASDATRRGATPQARLLNPQAGAALLA
jgi:hypothetical protein